MTTEAAITSASSEEGRLKPLEESLDAKICEKAARYAVRVCAAMTTRSTLLKQGATVAWLDRSEVMPFVGDLLGAGGFNNVYELETIQLKSSKRELDETEKLRQGLVQAKKPPVKLAIKFLSDETLKNPDDACNGSADLLMEAKYLTAIAAAHPHPGIIRLHGVSRSLGTGSASELGQPERASMFMVLERLYDTLDRRVTVWRELQRRKIAAQETGTRQYLRVLFLQRLLIGLDIVSALQHLHGLNLCFRDLKPSNIGFDYEGRVKIFDFGLAKELDPHQKKADDEYAMSGGTGSRRYMAPEVAVNAPYGLSADVYSFSILLWELLTLDRAYGQMTPEEHRSAVVKGTERPPMNPEWTVSLQVIMRGGWQRNAHRRPSAGTTFKLLRQEIQDCVARDFPVQGKADERARSGDSSSGR